MATRLTPKKSGGKKAEPKAVPSDQATPEETAANGPAAAAEATTATGEALAQDTALPQAAAPSEACSPDKAAPCTRSHTPNARTRKALRDADAGKNLTRYVDEDDLFRKLGIELGQEE